METIHIVASSKNKTKDRFLF